LRKLPEKEKAEPLISWHRVLTEPVSTKEDLLARIRKRGFLSERRFAKGLSVGEQAAAGPSGVSLPGIRGSQEEAAET
jgi:hypothetical protein